MSSFSDGWAAKWTVHNTTCNTRNSRQWWWFSSLFLMWLIKNLLLNKKCYLFWNELMFYSRFQILLPFSALHEKNLNSLRIRFCHKTKWQMKWFFVWFGIRQRKLFVLPEIIRGDFLGHIRKGKTTTTTTKPQSNQTQPKKKKGELDPKKMRQSMSCGTWSTGHLPCFISFDAEWGH